MPVIPGNQLTYLRNQHPHTARVEWYLAIAPYGTIVDVGGVPTLRSTFEALLDNIGAARGDMAIQFDTITVGSIASIQAGMTLWISDIGHNDYNLGRVRVRGLIIHYNSGSVEFTHGETLTGANSGDTGVVVHWTVTSGTWAGGNATGDVYVTNVTGDYQAENLNGSVGGANMATATAAINSMRVAENTDIAWVDDLFLTLPGAYGFRELWGKYPRLTEAGTVNFLMDYDDDFVSPDDGVIPPKANAGPPAVAWINPTTGLATVYFTDNRSYSTEAAIATYSWQLPGCSFVVALPAAADCVLWLDANQIAGLTDGDPVALWEDESGLGNDVTQGVGANQPTYRTNIINGLPAVQFDGATDYLSRASAVLNQIDAWTMVVVMRPTGLGTARRIAAYIGDGAVDGYGVASSGNVAGRISTLYGGVAWDDTSASYVNDTPCVIISERAAGTLTMYRNGTTLAPTFANVPNLPGAVTYIGWNGTNNRHSGYIAEVIIYDIALTAAQRQQLHAYLCTKYGLNVPGGYDCTTPLAVYYDTPGFYYASLTVTDNTAQARQGTVYVPVWIFQSGVEEPFTQVEVLDQSGNAERGWSAKLRVFRTNYATEDIVYHFPDGALVVLFTRTWFGDTETGVGGWCMASDPPAGKHYRDNIRFVGWLLGETLQFDHAAGTVEFEAVGHDGIMRLIPGWPNTVEDVGGAGTPHDWYEATNLNVDRALHYLLEFYSTVNQVCHVERAGEGNARPVKIQKFSSDNLYSQAQEDLLSDAKCRLLADRQGILYATRDPQFMDAGGRGGVDIACHLQQAQGDWMGQIDHDREHRSKTGSVRLGGFAYDTPILAHAPIATPGDTAVVPLQSASNERVDGCILQDQTEASLWAGLELAFKNNPYPQVPLDLTGYWPVFDPAYQEYVELTADDPLDRADWTQETFVVREVKFNDDSKGGTCLTSLVLEKATDILTGEAEEIPSPAPMPPVQPVIIPPPTWGGDLTHCILMTSQGIFVTESFHEPNPVWYATNNGLTDRLTLRDVSFDFAHGSRLFAVGASGAWRCNNIWNADAWAMPLTNADAITKITALGTDWCALNDVNWATYTGIWACVNCDAVTGYLEFIAGANSGGTGCGTHKRAFYSNDALALTTVGDILDHDAACGPGHNGTPWAGQVSAAGGQSLYTYVCGWGVGKDQHRGLSTNGGVAVSTCGQAGGQIGAWAANPVRHARAGEIVYYFVTGNTSLRLSTDNGWTWAIVGGGGLPVAPADRKHALAAHHLNATRLMYATSTNQLRASSDGGSTWSAAIAAVAKAACVQPTMVSGFPEGKAFIAGCTIPAVGAWIYLTKDFGVNWENKTGNLDTWLNNTTDSIYQIIPVQAGVP